MADRWEDDVDEALRGLRDDVPAMNPRAFIAGRARLLAHVGALPVAEATTEPNDPVVRALPADRRRRSPPLRKVAPWLTVAAAVTVVATGTIALLPGDSPTGGSPVGTSPAPSSTAVDPPPGVPPTGRPGEPLPPMPTRPLNPAGDLAATVADIPLKPGQFRYVRMAITLAHDADNGPGGTYTDELWIPYDRDGEWLRRREANTRAKDAADNGVEEKRVAGGRFDGHEPQPPWVAPAATPEKVAALPHDPAALYERLRAEVNAELPPGVGTTRTAAQDAVHIVFSMLSDMTGSVPSDLRAALLRTLGYLPGVTVTPNAVASDGRRAVALGNELDNGLQRNELLLDPATARLVEWRIVMLKEQDGFQAGQTFVADLRTEAVVAELGQRP